MTSALLDAGPSIDKPALVGQHENNPSDHQRPAKAAGREGEAWMAELYRMHAGPLQRYLSRLMFGNREAVDDIMQETLLRAWRNRDTLTAPIDQLRPWLVTVAGKVMLVPNAVVAAVLSVRLVVVVSGVTLCVRLPEVLAEKLASPP